ncbi:hypothetical protein Hanom_Chr04g00349511 [Helianthus anomalus]
MDMGRARAAVQAINTGAWLICKPSIGTPPLSHFTHHPPPSQHHHPLSIIECVSRLRMQD